MYVPSLCSLMKIGDFFSLNREECKDFLGQRETERNVVGFNLLFYSL